MIVSAVALFCGAALPLSAATIICPGGSVSVENAGDAAARICTLAARATNQLSSCNLTVPELVTIAVVPELEDQCLGLYHCGNGRIEILAPEDYVALQAASNISAFSQVSSEGFFESVIRHELAHAALDTMKCPFDACLIGQEYIAYTMQILFLPEVDQIAFEEAIPNFGAVSRDMLNPMTLSFSPATFARKAWLHLKAREDTCAFIGQIARGEVLLDRERP